MVKLVQLLSRLARGRSHLLRVQLAAAAFLACSLVSCSTGEPPAPPPEANPATGATPDNRADASRVREILAGLKLINYYPARFAQTRLWENWPPEILDQDFGRIADLHANAVRLALFPRTTGFPQPSPEAKSRLRQMFDLAQRHGLHVKLTLFGFWNHFTDVAGSQRWVQALLGPYRGRADLAVIDLYNELDLHQPGAVEWARALLPFVRAVLPGVPVTVSVSNTSGVRGLKLLRETGLPLDFYEFHYYGKPELAGQTFHEALRAVGSAPLFIGETGYSSDPTAHHQDFPCSRRWWEFYQDQYHRTVQAAAQATGLPPAAPWVFSDFTADAFPSDSKSGADRGEYAFGLSRADGTLKPAGAGLSAFFGTGPVDLSFNNGFEIDDGAGRPALWRLWQPQAARFSRDPHVSHSGQASACIRSSSPAKSADPAFYLSPVQPIWSGRVCVATVWARGEQATGSNRLSLAWFDARGKFLSQNASPPLPEGTSTWTRLTVKARAPAGSASAQIHLASRNNSGAVWFDDVTFMEMGE